MVRSPPGLVALAARAKAALAVCRDRGHHVGRYAHAGEHVMHVAYLGGVTFGGEALHHYAAGGMLLCILVAWVLHSGD